MKMSYDKAISLQKGILHPPTISYLRKNPISLSKVNKIISLLLKAKGNNQIIVLCLLQKNRLTPKRINSANPELKSVSRSSNKKNPQKLLKISILWE
jgi:hypothetical protein